ncbi:MAG: Ig-like domain-containing protein, partial [Cellvibrionaceae bacterium]|nr:Ig-like domain-containing protein [Cellvibrionaceae bacterium]
MSITIQARHYDGFAGQTIQSNTTIQTRQILLQGTAEPNQPLRLYNGDQYVGIVTADEHGNWQGQLDNIKNGSHQYSVRSLAAEDGSFEASEAVNITVDAAPISTTEVVLPDNTTIIEGGSRDDSTPVFSGWLGAGAKVTASINGHTYGPVDTKPNGSWQIAVSDPLPNGEHLISLMADLPNGQRAYLGVRFTLDTNEPPEAPQIQLVQDNVGLYQGNLEKGGHSDDDILSVRGTGPALTLIEVYNGDVLLGQTEADENGNWSFSPTIALAEGRYQLNVVAVDEHGQRSQPSANFGLTIDRTSETVKDFKVVDDVGAITGNISANHSSDDLSPTLRGSGQPGAIIKIFNGDASIATVRVDANGQWQYQADFTEGDYSLSVSHTDLAGNTGPRTEPLPFSIKVQAPKALSSVEIVDGGDEHLSQAELDAGVTIKLGVDDGALAGERVEIDVNGDGVADASYLIGAADIGNTVETQIDGSQFLIAADNSVSATAVVVSADAQRRSEAVADSSGTGRAHAALDEGAKYYQYLNRYTYYNAPEIETDDISYDNFYAGTAHVWLDDIAPTLSSGDTLVASISGLPDDWVVRDAYGNEAQVINGVADISNFRLLPMLQSDSSNEDARGYYLQFVTSDNETYTDPIAAMPQGDEEQIVWETWRGNERNYTLEFKAQIKDADSGQLSEPMSANFEMNYVHEFEQYLVSEFCLETPLILDLDGDGVETLALQQGVVFDIDGDGQLEHSAWLAPDDGLLVRDIDGNGRIDSGAELFGSATALADGTQAEHGFAALAELDSNSDGVIDAQDQHYRQLQLWRDQNSDGQSQADELLSLSDAGVVSIALDAQIISETDNGNLKGLRSSWTDDRGETRVVDDVWFNTAPLDEPVATADLLKSEADTIVGLPHTGESGAAA